LHILEYLLVRALLTFYQCLSYKGALAVARFLARLATKVDAKPRARSIANLQLIFGDALDQVQRERITRGSYESISRHVAEVAHIGRQRGRNLVIENGEMVRELYARGRGVIAVSAHMGPFVRMAMVPKLLGIRVAAVMKKQDNQMVHNWGRTYVREQFDIQTFLKKDARGMVEDLLKEGYLVGLFADQHPRSGGFPCSFFGRQVLAAAGPAIYAKRCGSPLVVVTAVPRGDEIVLRWEGPVDTDGTHEEISQRWMSILEDRIRDYPETWTWMHRRWRDKEAPDIREVADAALAASKGRQTVQT